MSTLHYHKKNQQFWSQYSSVPGWHQCLHHCHTKQKTMYFAVCSSIPQLIIQILLDIDLFTIMQYALFFFELWKWQEVVDIDNFACLVPLHAPTIYSMQLI